MISSHLLHILIPSVYHLSIEFTTLHWINHHLSIDYPSLSLSSVILQCTYSYSLSVSCTRLIHSLYLLILTPANSYSLSVTHSFRLIYSSVYPLLLYTHWLHLSCIFHHFSSFTTSWLLHSLITHSYSFNWIHCPHPDIYLIHCTIYPCDYLSTYHDYFTTCLSPILCLYFRFIFTSIHPFNDLITSHYQVFTIKYSLLHPVHCLLQIHSFLLNSLLLFTSLVLFHVQSIYLSLNSLSYHLSFHWSHSYPVSFNSISSIMSSSTYH